MSDHIAFDNTYARLPDRFYAQLAPTPVSDPEWIFFNKALSEDLDLPTELLSGDVGLEIFSGNRVPERADPIAQAYAGHQFGGFSPQLGDGRAHLLGEVVGRDGQRRDIQLKGSGPTPFSRMGDGRAWVGPVLREYIVSEAMYALGIPTTRSLAAVKTGDTVVREAPFPGAVLTRVASSHIRIGTFQYFAARRDIEALRTLTDYTIERHYPEAEGALGLLRAVIQAQAALVARWMGVGFVHGVMNTDNTQIAGETIDYGPCAFLDTYHPETVFSSIDSYGRYAYGKQPQILAWNLAQLATSLIPLMGDDTDKALDLAQEEMAGYKDALEREWASVFRAKLGLSTAEPGDLTLATDLLDRMAANAADFTNTFRALGTPQARDQFIDPGAFDAWETEWLARLTREPDGARARIEAVNPAVIPRNHRIEEAIQAALSGDLTPSRRLIDALKSPFNLSEDNQELSLPPLEEERVLQTFCGT